MRKTFTLIAFVLTSSALFAQLPASKPSYKLYGFARGDAAVDSRQNVASFEGLFLLYPADIREDSFGADINDVPTSGFYSFNSRLGIDISGFELGSATISGKVEGDFAGFSGAFGSNFTTLRLRHAYVKLDWDKTSLTVGQAWHPMFSPVMPGVISLSVGAPFNPFSRAPQIMLNYTAGNFIFKGAALYQFQFASGGPSGKSSVYQRNSAIPELYFGVDYKNNGLIAGAGVDYLTIRPMIELAYTDGGVKFTRKITENLSSISYSAHIEYKKNKFSAGAKSIYGENLSYLTMLGGYGISKLSPEAGVVEYTNYRHSTTWVNAGYGTKYRFNLFGGYTKSLGTADALFEDAVGKFIVYGEGLNINELYRAAATFSYNVDRFMLGAEYELTSAHYGDAGTLNLTDGKYGASHASTNHRLVGVISYTF